MWRLLQAEIAYNRSIMVYFCVLSIMSFSTVHSYSQIFGRPVAYPNPGIISLGHIFFFAIGSILASSWWKEQTYRYHIQLPIATWKIGVLRLGTFVVYWFLISSVYMLWSDISRYFALDRKGFLVLCTQTGLFLTTFSLIFFWRDLRKIFDSGKTTFGLPSHTFFGAVILVLALLIGFTSMAGTVHTYQGNDGNLIDRILSWLYQSKIGPAILILFGFCSAIVTISTFTHRRSYID